MHMESILYTNKQVGMGRWKMRTRTQMFRQKCAGSSKNAIFT